ncbi:hypothetical protein BJY17_000751 [Agromyces hippuratus]|uniref:HIRAN domain-containing protein n=1 Tax=Agromyces hippuratus TaxID=286438 RepID=A0A852WY43_9MICO|nr:hypothetical protein [Agromyces hippuratus]NYG20004.1 hypothetical protein [Agromyces hippuratus]
MSILKRIFGGADKKPATTVALQAPSPAPAQEGRVRLEVSFAAASEQDLVKLTGTTTFAKDAITELASRHSIDGGGYLEIEGSLQREPENQADPKAVAVHVEGERIGYLPGYVASGVDLSASGGRAVKVQIFTEVLPKGLRAEAWAWLGKGAPKWQWSESKRPPMSSGAKVAAHQQSIDAMVADALANGGSRAESFEDGMVSGVHYLQLVEPIKQLKREDRLEDALVLCYAAIAGAEAAARREKLDPAPWYTEQAAIIHRKLGQRAEEVAVLRRYLAACPPDRRNGRIKERLEKLRA